MISGGGKDRRLISWAPDAASSSAKVAEAEVEEALGPVRCLAMGKGHTVVVGTTKNAILQGGLDVGFSPIVRGHTDELWGLAIHPAQHQFVSAAHDKMVRATNIRRNDDDDKKNDSDDGGDDNNVMRRRKEQNNNHIPNDDNDLKNDG